MKKVKINTMKDFRAFISEYISDDYWVGRNELSQETYYIGSKVTDNIGMFLDKIRSNEDFEITGVDFIFNSGIVGDGVQTDYIAGMRKNKNVIKLSITDYYKENFFNVQLILTDRFLENYEKHFKNLKKLSNEEIAEEFSEILMHRSVHNPTPEEAILARNSLIGKYSSKHIDRLTWIMYNMVLD